MTPEATSPEPADGVSAAEPGQGSVARDPRAARRIADFVRVRLGPRLPPRDVERLQAYLSGLARGDASLPARGRGFDLPAIATASGVDPCRLQTVRHTLRPGLRALARELAKPRRRTEDQRQAGRDAARRIAPLADQPVARPGPWVDPPGFSAALGLHIARHGDTRRGLVRWLAAQGQGPDRTTFEAWLRGRKTPTHPDSLAVLSRLETRWRLPCGYFREKLPGQARARGRVWTQDVPPAERRLLAWHLPDDFARRPAFEQEEILDWARRVAAPGATDYRRYQALAVRNPYSLRFPGLQRVGPRGRVAPPGLTEEVVQLMGHMTARFAPAGAHRRGFWGPETASHRASHLGLWFGALAAPPGGAAAGLGVDPEALTLALLAFPAVWDRLLAWREARRGFFTVSETSMLDLARSLTASDCGWLTQSPHLAARLQPVPGLVDGDDISRARSDWRGLCAQAHRHAAMRRLDVRRLVRRHNDPFEAIAPVLAADQPLAAYRAIADEVRKRRPDPQLHPVAWAESLRAYLMIRLGLHLGFRQRNLRELLVCPKGCAPRSEATLADLRRGELRWDGAEDAWEVFAPAAAFKNAGSTFFRGRPFRLRLTDASGLYEELETYLAMARPRLILGADDPGTLFVKTVKGASRQAAYGGKGFYQAWRAITARHGVFNPWTGRGAIVGLLPHGPHAIRDVLATHVLKQTGSFEQASFAIQSTPDTVARHYARFLPEEKSQIAARLLEPVWR